MKNNYMCSAMAFCWGAVSITLNLIGQQIISYIAITLGAIFVFAFERLK